MRTTVLLLLALLLAPAAAGAATRSVRAPGGALEAQVRVGAGGAATVLVRRAGRVVLRADAGRLPGRIRARRATVEDRFTTPSGKRRRHRLHARRLELRAAGGHGLDVLAAPDGVALRLRGAGSPEPTTFRAPAGTTAWLQDYTAGYEGPYVRRRLARAPARRYGFPALLRAPSGTATLLTESGLRPGDGAAHLEARGGRLRVAPPGRTRSDDPTAWRVAVIGSLATVVGSDLPLALGRPSRIRDTSWIEPGRAAWSWWADSASTSRPARLADYASLAQRLGWEYQVVDARWRREQLPGIVADGTAKGVRSLLWFDADDLDTAAERARVLDDVRDLGFAGVKVDYLLSDRPARIRLYEEIAHAAAARRLVVVFHGATVPRGLQRTWPNVLAVEAVRGAESARRGPALDPAQDVDLVFTRNPLGAMDFTPVAFSAARRRSTDAHELATAVAFESGLQSYADTPEAYAARPAAEAVLRAVPAAWDGTRLVAGTPGRLAAIARRSGATWWLGVLAAGPARRTPALALSFLAPGRTYTATVTADGPDGLTTTTRAVTRETVLREPLRRDGGLVVRLAP